MQNEDINIYLKKFREAFPTDDSCLNFLAALKWKDGFKCRKCGNTNYCGGKQLTSRRCTRCKKEESATANTVFHRCKFSLQKAFEIVLLTCRSYDISSYKVSDMLDLRHMTCYSFQKKVSNCLVGEEGSDFLKELIVEIQKRIDVK